jgi:uncharacterized protein YndB with AHSA1/START domain
VRETAAPPEAVFDVLVDHRRYAEITRLRRSELEREGDPAPNGVGAIRVLGILGPPMREEVLAYERPTRFSYTLFAGLPLRKHNGTVELTPQGGGTRIVYSVRAIPAVPVVGSIAFALVKQGVKQLLDGVVAEAESQVATTHG